MPKPRSPQQVRKLKVSASYRRSHSQYVPKINVCGDWLRAAGLAIGDQVQVTVSENQLIISKAA